MAKRPKTIKTTTVETEVTGESPESQVLDSPLPAHVQAEIDQEDMDLTTFVNTFGTECLRITIQRRGVNGVMAYLGTCSPEVANEEYLQETYGGGRFLLRLVNQKGKWITTRQVVIEGPPKETAPTASKFFPQMNSGGNGDALQAIALQLAAMQGELAGMRNNPPGEKSGLSELAEALVILKNTFIPPAPAQATPQAAVSDLIGILKQGIELGQAGVSTEKSGWSGIVSDIAKAIPEVLKTFTAPASDAAPLKSSAIPRNGKEDQSMEIAAIAQLKAGIQWLKSKARQNQDPEFWVEFVMNTLEERQWLPLMNYLEKPYDELAALDAELLNPLYRPWFESFLSGLRGALNEKNAIDGPAVVDDNAGISPGNEPPS